MCSTQGAAQPCEAEACAEARKLVLLEMCTSQVQADVWRARVESWAAQAVACMPELGPQR